MENGDDRKRHFDQLQDKIAALQTLLELLKNLRESVP